MKQVRQMSDTFLLASLLALTGGFLDAYTYLCRGGVFANAQTGNMVLLGIRAAQGDFAGCLYYLTPILFFVFGILLAELVGHKWRQSKKIHWRQIILLLEIAVLAGVAWVPSGEWDILANSLVSFICALQVQSFRKMNGSAYASTMCTGNLRSATEQVFAYRRTRDKSLLRQALQYYGVCGFFVVGAAAGFWVTGHVPGLSIFFACTLLALVFGILFVKGED